MFKDFTSSFLVMIISYLITKLDLPPYIEDLVFVLGGLMITALFIDKIIEYTLFLLKAHKISAGIAIILESLTLPEILKYTDNPFFITILIISSMFIYSLISLAVEKIILNIYLRSPWLKKYETVFLISLLLVSHVGKIAVESEMITNTGHDMYINGNLIEAMEKYDKAIELFPFNTKAYYYKGVAYSSMGKFWDSLACYDKCIPLKCIEFGRGYSYYNLQKYQNALDAFDRAIMMDPFDLDSRFNKGLCLISLNEFNDSLNEFEKIMILNDTDSRGWFGQGFVLYRSRQYNKAIDSLKEAIEINQLDVQAWFYLGKAYQKIQECEYANEAFNKVIEIHTSQDHLKAYLENLRNESIKLRKTCEYSQKISNGRY